MVKAANFAITSNVCEKVIKAQPGLWHCGVAAQDGSHMIIVAENKIPAPLVILINRLRRD